MVLLAVATYRSSRYQCTDCQFMFMSDNGHLQWSPQWCQCAVQVRSCVSFEYVQDASSYVDRITVQLVWIATSVQSYL
jgi:hypothetical protein